MERTMKGAGSGWGRHELVFRLVKCKMPMRNPNGAMNELGECASPEFRRGSSWMYQFGDHQDIDGV